MPVQVRVQLARYKRWTTMNAIFIEINVIDLNACNINYDMGNFGLPVSMMNTVTEEPAE